MTKISLIAAIGEGRELGKDNDLIFRIPEDLKRFKRITSGHPIIMGRKTYESIGRVLPNRTNIIVTRDKNYKVPGAVVCSSLKEAIERAKMYLVSNKIQNTNEVFVIGGGQIFEQAIPFANKLYLTIVKGHFDADVYFPDYSAFKNVRLKENGRWQNYEYTFWELEK